MYNISFHLKLYRIIYWTKKYSPKLRFHNKVVYKCKSLSNWWLWACKSTFYLIKKGRICGPCETKHDKPNRLAVHCIHSMQVEIMATFYSIFYDEIIVLLSVSFLKRRNFNGLSKSFVHLKSSSMPLSLWIHNSSKVYTAYYIHPSKFVKNLNYQSILCLQSILHF